jgi:protein TonB
MADVLIVCVREDEPQAKALAEMFEAAGFSIGGAPSSDAALRSSGAGVVVWSQASIRSRPFLDAAQRVINANKAVVASLIEPPPPSSIGDSPAFDLSRWDGDPNDPSLDPLFFAVDRMVNAARTSVGAPAHEEDYEAPPPQPAPPRPAPRPAPAPPPSRHSHGAPAGDQLGSEAEHWRAIRDSRNPADFMDYLSRYGPQGAFAEVAELRLKQLTAGGASQRQAPAQQRTAPSRYPEQQRREPQRRPETSLPPPRRAEAPRRMPPDRSYDRADLREPSRDGGPLRAIVLIALLGGAALGGGLYFGGGMGGFGASAPPEQTADVGADPLDTPSGVPIGEEGADVEAPPVQILADRTQPTAPTREQTPPRERAPAPQTTTVASNNTQSGSGGPLSLVPGGGQPPGQTVASPPAPNTGGTATPLAPSPASAITTAPPQPQTDSAALRGTVGSVVWAQRPTARRISELYPQRALREGLGGRVQLDCEVQANLNVSCAIASESPAGQGFGRAALSASSAYRARATLSDGTSAVGTRTRIAVNFQAPQ